MSDDVRGLIINLLSSLVGGLAVWLFTRMRITARGLGASRGLANRLTHGGISRFHLSRDDYRDRAGGGNLPAYLATAEVSIDIISISLRLTQDEGQLIKLFRNKLFQHPDFRLTISLLNPFSITVESVAESLDVPATRQRTEIVTMLSELKDLRDSLPDPQRKRLRILVHDCQPMGSAIMKDATPNSGVIQVETKLYRAPRIESFGYEVVGPSPFYSRNYTAWKRVLDDSRDISDADIQLLSAGTQESDLLPGLPKPAPVKDAVEGGSPASRKREL